MTQQEKKEESATCHDASEERLGEPEPRSIKKGMATDDFQTDRMGFHPTRKKGKKENCQMVGSREVWSKHIPKWVAGHGLLKEPKPKEGKDEKTGNRTC